MRRVSTLMALSLFVVLTAEGGTSPRAGFRKCDLFARPNATAPATLFRLPDASAATRLSVDVPFDFVETYDTKYLISVAIDKLDRLRDLATPMLIGFFERDDYDKVRTQVGIIDTRDPISLPRNGLPDANYPPGELGIYLIQFHGPEKPEWITSVEELGAVRVLWTWSNAYYVAATPEVAATVHDLPFLQWSTPLHPYLKKRPGDGDYFGGRVRVSVGLARVPGSQEAIARIFGPEVSTFDIGDLTWAEGILTPERVEAALKEPLVVVIWHDTGGGTGGGGLPQIPTLSPYLLAALAVALAAVALRR